jgi:large subunit ribosomal protein L22
MEARARIRNVPIAPRKARLVADLIKKLDVEEALNQLTFTHKVASPIIHKLIKSAVANALNQDSALDEGSLYVKQIIVDDGITRKWIRPRARGMANRILRRRCHITVVLDEEGEENGD